MTDLLELPSSASSVPIPYEKSCQVLVERCQLSHLDLPGVHPIVVSDSLKQTDLAAVPKSHIRGGAEDWYFLGGVTRHPTQMEEYLIKPYHFISHGALAYFNRHRRLVWTIPLILCQTYEAVIQQSAFNVYQQRLEVQPPEDTIALFEEAFHTRMHLYKWTQASVEFQIRHPLTSRQLQFAGVSTHGKRIDNIVYHLLAFALQWVADARKRWIRCESELLLFKLLLRPQLHAPILRIVGKPVTGLDDAADSIEQVHAKHITRIAEMKDDEVFHREGNLTRLAIAFLRELIRWEKLEKQDAEAASSLDPSNGASPSHKLKAIRQCAPACMKKAMTSAMGSTQQQAQLPQHHRRHLTMFLLKCGQEEETIARIMRPRVMIQYEMEEGPKEAWVSIQTGIQETADAYQRSLESSASADPDARFAAQTCQTLMYAGVCPFQAAVNPNSHLLTDKERKAHNQQRFMRAKKQCHAQLQEEGASLIQSPSIGKKNKRQPTAPVLPRDWASDPSMFTQQKLRLRSVNHLSQD